ncbi:MAG TPA: hypothetical protein VNY73_05965 [Bacteroidia bacterium]|jgi:hypothetical protein|nr:hypothetical protein [Bacteroidia bacterium]
MKKISLLIVAASLTLAACSSKKTAKSTTAAASATGTKTATGPLTDPNDVMVTAAKTKFPDVTLDALKKGHSIYHGACTRCHGAKNIVKRDEKEWVGILDDMAPKAKLSAEEKDAVWKYIMGVKLANI